MWRKSPEECIIAPAGMRDWGRERRGRCWDVCVYKTSPWDYVFIKLVLAEALPRWASHTYMRRNQKMHCRDVQTQERASRHSSANWLWRCLTSWLVSPRLIFSTASLVGVFLCCAIKEQEESTWAVVRDLQWLMVGRLLPSAFKAFHDLPTWGR